MRVALAQMNPRVGDFGGNLAKARDMAARAKSDGAEVVVFPEFTLIGYPPKDLLLRTDFVDASLRALDDFARTLTGIPAVVGYADPNTGPSGKPLRNALAVVADGRIVSRHYKQLLPTYDCFDEARYFEPTPPPGATNVATIAGLRVGITICEDIWCEPPLPGGRSLYHHDPVASLIPQPTDWVVNISASPYGLGKPQSRPQMYARQANRLARPVVVVNQVGAHDDLIFDGNSCAFDSRGNLIAHGKEFAEDLLTVDLDAGTGRVERPAADQESVYHALLFALRQFAFKSKHPSVLLHLRGDVNSSLVATLAAHALGPQNVPAVARSFADDAAVLARRLGIQLHSFPLSANEDQLPLSSATKTDLALGRFDPDGLLAPLADLTQTRALHLARWVNDHFDHPIPSHTLKPHPSADALDYIITEYVEHERPWRDITAPGFSGSDVERVIQQIDAAEFKRRRAPVPFKLTSRTFGPGRPMPLVR